MKTINLTTLLLILINLFQPVYAQEANNDVAIQNAILYHINDYRQKHGMSKLIMDERIVQEAKIHSQDMARHAMPFGHKHFLKRVNHLHAKIKNSGAAAENVAYNYKDAQDVVKNWLRSPGHKQNIDGNYNLTGIGIARDTKGKIYFTQIFLNNKAHTQVARRGTRSRIFISPYFRRA